MEESLPKVTRIISHWTEVPAFESEEDEARVLGADAHRRAVD